jgi:hypothetical protein
MTTPLPTPTPTLLRVERTPPEGRTLRVERTPREGPTPPVGLRLVALGIAGLLRRVSPPIFRPVGLVEAAFLVSALLGPATTHALGLVARSSFVMALRLRTDVLVVDAFTNVRKVQSARIIVPVVTAQ